jgi:hypothetical protein
MKEVWKDVVGYEGLYQVSNLGNVKSVARAVKRIGQSDLPVKERILKQQDDKAGYKTAMLSKGGKLKLLKVHRLVAIAFIENPEGYPIINHKDENKQNNKADNLEWCTHKYNTNYGNAQKRKKLDVAASLKNLEAARKKQYKKVAMCDEAGNELKVFDSIAAAALYVNNTNHTSSIIKCCKGERKKAYGYTWKYK